MFKSCKISEYPQNTFCTSNDFNVIIETFGKSAQVCCEIRRKT